MADPAGPRWGIVTTVKAPLDTTLRFLAYHLDLGAQRIFLYVDDCDAETLAFLADHDRVTAISCDDAHWQRINRGRRPGRHQTRQTMNASAAYGALTDIDWLAHIDVDEFLWPRRDVAAILADLPDTALVTRIRPAEALSNDDVHDAQPGAIWFKTFIPADGHRLKISTDVYPTFGNFLRGGFLSHVAGKLFVRAGMAGAEFRIHNLVVNGEENPGQVVCDDMDLCHLHATTWQAWQHTYRFRVQRGSYRAEMSPAVSREKGGLNLNEMFSVIEADNGQDGLRAFFDEVCRATPEHRQRLQKHGHLDLRRLELTRKLAQQFPDWTTTVS